VEDFDLLASPLFRACRSKSPYDFECSGSEAEISDLRRVDRHSQGIKQWLQTPRIYPSFCHWQFFAKAYMSPNTVKSCAILLSGPKVLIWEKAKNRRSGIGFSRRNVARSQEDKGSLRRKSRTSYSAIGDRC
jgi:hypothetical protein